MGIGSDSFARTKVSAVALNLTGSRRNGHREHLAVAMDAKGKNIVLDVAGRRTGGLLGLL
jgi:hypothetical protein